MLPARPAAPAVVRAAAANSGPLAPAMHQAVVATASGSNRMTAPETASPAAAAVQAAAGPAKQGSSSFLLSPKSSAQRCSFPALGTC